MQKFTARITQIKAFWRAYFFTNKAQYLNMKIATGTIVIKLFKNNKTV